MSLCQSKGSSCGACCGLFNLDYPPAVLKRILEERTTIFSEKVDYAKMIRVNEANFRNQG
jgi:hypothetical protein